jgi:hypothetical protein
VLLSGELTVKCLSRESQIGDVPANTALAPNRSDSAMWIRIDGAYCSVHAPHEFG